MLNFQDELDLSSYSGLYDILVKEDHLLRKLNNLVDFTFIIDEVKENYCLNDGRNAIDPIRMFKYLLLKVIYENFYEGEITGKRLESNSSQELKK